MTHTIQALFLRIVSELTTVHSDAVGAAQEAWWLLAHVTGRTQAQLMAYSQSEVLPEHVALVLQLVHDRVHNHKPLQYILGSVPFGDLTLLVRPPVFIPRPETEEWLIAITQHLASVRDQPLRILDICTGSGCVALYLASKFPHAQVTGIDKNLLAVQLAQENAARNDVNNCTFLLGDMFSAIKPSNQFDMVVSNPPYLSESEWAALSDSCRLWEDKAAFVGGDDGMDVYRTILSQVAPYLAQDTMLTQQGLAQLSFEIGPAQYDLLNVASQYGFSNAWIGNDMQGKARWFFGRR